LGGPRRGAIAAVAGAVGGVALKLSGDWLYSTSRTAWIAHRKTVLEQSRPRVIMRRSVMIQKAQEEAERGRLTGSAGAGAGTNSSDKIGNTAIPSGSLSVSGAPPPAREVYRLFSFGSGNSASKDMTAAAAAESTGKDAPKK
jgi:hypothetical protein